MAKRGWRHLLLGSGEPQLCADPPRGIEVLLLALGVSSAPRTL